ncbi:peptidase M16 inactive domain protein [mine drainage metagenome]|uniref:Peptidase M16 inactive domain protein n=1 Tax=mine drainage metagenome TaxID=410659 RepID=A0A1J5S6M2_9ZZZZ
MHPPAGPHGPRQSKRSPLAAVQSRVLHVGRACVTCLLLASSWLSGAPSLRAAGSGPWPEFRTDLPADPALHAGRLANGLRYFVYPNAVPKDHIVMRLIVAAGSRNEREGQYGVAHLVEHMAFRSARDGDSNTLMRQMERLGVGLGPGVTAYTYYDSTQYLLDLPRSDPAHLLAGLKLFRAFAADTRFDPAEVETEKRVVLSELNMRMVEGDDSSYAYDRFLWPELVNLRRAIGGTTLSVSGLNGADCASFYATWYRPDRMAVIIVGPVDPGATIDLLGKTLGNFGAKTAEAPPIPPPTKWIPPASARPRIETMPSSKIHQIGLWLSRSWIEPPIPLSHGRELWETHIGLALAMFQQRMKELSLRPGYRLGAIQVSTLDPYPALGLHGVMAGISGDAATWQQTLRTLVIELRRAEMYGFTPREFQLARQSYANVLKEGIRYWPSRASDQIAQSILHTLQSGRPMLTAQTAYAHLSPLIDKATLQACNRDFREAWANGRLPDIFILAPPSLAMRHQAIRDVLHDAMEARLSPPRDPKQVAAFAYESFGKPGTLAQERHVADLDVWLDRFANGVRFNFKHTTFESDTVQAYIRVGTGKLSLPRDKPGLWLAAQSALLPGGLRRQSAETLAAIAATHLIWTNFYVLDDALLFQVQASREDFPLALKIATAYIEDPALPDSIMPSVRVGLNSVFDQISGSPWGKLTRDQEPIIAGGDTRFGLGSRTDALARSMPEIRAWLRPQLQSGPIEMSIVGDITYEDARSLVADTLGTLPQRNERPPDGTNGIRKFAPPDFYPLQATGMPYQDGISYVWMIPWARTMQQDRRLRLVAAVLDQRLRSRLREALGMSYVTSVQYITHPGFDDFSYLTFYTGVNAAQLQSVISVLEADLRLLASSGVTEDEFERAKSPWVSSYDTNLTQNSYWGATVLADAQQRPGNIEAARNRTLDTHSITRAEINALLARILDSGSTLRFIVQMSAPAAPQPDVASR